MTEFSFQGELSPTLKYDLIWTWFILPCHNPPLQMPVKPWAITLFQCCKMP